MAIEEIHKKTWKDRFSGVFTKVFGKFRLPKMFQSKEPEIETGSYTKYLKHISPDDLGRSLEDVKKASELCQRAVKIAGLRATYANKQQELSSRMLELEKVEQMTEKEKEDVSKLMEQYRHAENERKSLRGQITGFDRILDYLEPLEQQVPTALENMRESEEKQRRVRRDINYIEGERGELEYNKENIHKGLMFIYNITIGVIVAFALFVAVGIALYFYRDIDFFIAGVCGCIVLIMFTTILFIFKRRMLFEEKLNVLLQMRAVALLNRKRLVYVHHTNFLNYEYRKFRVRSADELKHNFEEYGLYKHVTGRYDAVRNIVYMVEDDLTDLLKSKGIINTRSSLKQMEKILDFNNNARLYKDTVQELASVELSLDPLDDEQARLWEELTALKEADITQERVIAKMIKEYFEHLDNIVLLSDDELAEELKTRDAG